MFPRPEPIFLCFWTNKLTNELGPIGIECDFFNLFGIDKFEKLGIAHILYVGTTCGRRSCESWIASLWGLIMLMVG